MGIKGTVRRSTDGHIIHANIDTDVIIAEEPTDGQFSTEYCIFLCCSEYLVVTFIIVVNMWPHMFL